MFFPLSFVSSLLPRPPTPTLFPYTTLFRSLSPPKAMSLEELLEFIESDELIEVTPHHLRIRKKIRSEEHTSELQSRGHLVCRLLLEKKKRNTRRASA